MKSKTHQKSFAALAASFLLIPAHGQVQLNYPLGESDPGAVAAGAGNAATVETVGAKNLSVQGSGNVYSSNVPAVPSTLSMSFNGNGHYAATGQSFYTGLDLNNFEVSVDVYPTAVSGFNIALSMGHNGAGALFLYHVGDGGTWRLHSNGNGDRISGGTVTFSQWQNLRVVRTGGVMTLFVNGVSVGSSPAFSSTGTLGDTLTIGAHTKDPGTFESEGRFIGQIDNVVIGAPDDDGDGLPNAWESANGLDPKDDGTTNVINGAAGDPDLDTFSNLAEFTAGSDPQNPASTPTDTDADGLADAWEILNFSNLAQIGTGDPDGDFATNEQEETADTRPTDRWDYPDTDMDFLSDGWELHYFRATPEESEATILAKWDGGGDPDTDSFTNLAEHDAGTDPTSAASTPDSDSDGLPDSWEVLYFRASPSETVAEIITKYDELDDPDNDGSNNGREFDWGTEPSNASNSPPAKLTNQHLWKLGEHDSGATVGGSLNAVTRDVSDGHLDRTGTNGTYSAEVPSGGSTISANFTGTEIFGGTGKGFFSGFDPENYSLSFDARPTASNSFHIAVTIGSNRDADGAGQNLFVYHAGGTWHVHSNGNGDFDSTLPATLNTWQNIRFERVNGVNTLYVDNVASATFTTLANGSYPSSLRDAVSIGGNRNNGGFEGGFIGQIDNVNLITPPLPPADADGDGLLDKWETIHGLSIASGTGSDGPDGDPDGDGANNFHEFAFGGDPRAASDRGPSLGTVVEISGERYFSYTFAVRSGAAFGGSGPLAGSSDGVDYEITGSRDFTSSNLELAVVFPSVDGGLPAAPTGYTYHTIRLADPISAAAAGFIRAKATSTPPAAP